VSRFRPNRLGLIELAEYPEETFDFADGRLVLQGHNGAGKSKALELSVPLLFSGETRPQHLDTFGGASKKLKDIVLWSESSKIDYPQRTGYAWLEFAKPDEGDAEDRFVTIGVGMHAHREWPDVRTRFFLLDGPRVGVDVHLQAPNHDVVTFPRLREALGDPPGAEIVDTAREFRRLQDEMLFGFEDEDRYSVMVRLLLALRRPNLSENMDPERVGELLGQTLPPVDAELIGQIGGLLEELERIGDEQAEAERAAEAVRAVHERYRLFAAAVARERSDELRSAIKAHARALRAQRGAGDRLSAARAELGEVEAGRETAENEIEAAFARLEELRRSPEARSAQALEERENAVRRTVESARQLGEAAAHASRAAEESAAQAQAADEELAQASEVARESEAETATEAEAAGIEGHRAASCSAFEPDGADPGALRATLNLLAEERGEQVRGQRQFDDAAARARDERDIRRAARDEQAETLAAAMERHAELASEVEAEAAAHVERVAAWTETASMFAELAESERERVIDRAGADGAGDPTAGGRALAAELTATASREVARKEGSTEAAERRLAEQAAALEAERAALEDRSGPTVPAPHWRSERDGSPEIAPLWRLIDFRDGWGSESARGGLEGALDGTGLLDALVDASGVTWHQGDLALQPGAAAEPSLQVALVPDRDCPAELRKRVEGALSSIALGGEPLPSGAPGCGEDGRFAYGPARGVNALPRPRLIGEAARERSRAEQLERLARQIASLEKERGDRREERAGLATRRAELETQLNAYPDPGALRAGERAVTMAREREREAREELERRGAAADAAEQALHKCQEEASAHRARNNLDGRLDDVENALRRYAVCAEALCGCAEALFGAAGRQWHAQERASRDQARADDAAAASAAAAREASALEEALSEARRIAGDGPARVLDRISSLQRERQEAKERARQLTDRQTELANRVGSCEQDCEGRDAAVTSAAAEIVEREDGLRGLVAADFLRLTLGDLAPPDAVGDASWDSQRCAELAELVLAEAPNPEAGQSGLAGEVDDGYASLREALGSHPRLRVFMERTDGLPALGALVDGKQRTFVELAGWIDAELSRLRMLLNERQASLLAEHLADDVAEHLHDRVYRAREWIDRAAKTTERCRTTSGMGVVLRLRDRDDEQPGLRRALSLLGKSPSLLAETERQELVRFLFERIQRTRDGEGEESLERLLARALDYRTWFRFELQVRMPNGELKPFTRRRKEIGSGGEREVLLHLPLLAAAAAVYDAAAPHCPRLIALDEAFNKVDETGERGLLEVVVGLDLDFLLCGYDLWCAHPEVPAVEIYHLKRWDEHFGVVPLHRWRWNGQRTVPLDPQTGEAA
jgi:uncharacterized protein (TIGR02680 family)